MNNFEIALKLRIQIRMFEKNNVFGLGLRWTGQPPYPLPSFLFVQNASAPLRGNFTC